MRFVTTTGRAKHMNAYDTCRRWWEAFSKNAREQALQKSTNESSSEVGSDDDCYRLTDTVTMIDDGLEVGANLQDHEETETFGTHDDDFTISPWGVVFRPADVIDEAAREPIITIEEFTGAARVYGEYKNLYTQIWESDELFEQRRKSGPFYPFSGAMEWEMVEWLQTLNVPMERIDHFLGLSYVRSSSFKLVA